MMLKGKTVLVTGGTGSMGQRLVHRILEGEQGVPRKVIVFSRDEAKQHDMRMRYLNRSVTTDEVIFRNFMQILEFRIGNVSNFEEVCSAVRDSEVIINAAALKQVPTCEYFPIQALSTNCEGTNNIVRAIRENGYRVEVVVGISTDKACKPVNVMGMTKALQERILISANVLNPHTRFVCVRYGNVLASRGSVIPLFLEQIRNGGPLTITVPGMTRFLLSLDQAVDTVFAALAKARAGETWVPRAPSSTVANIAKALIGKRRVETTIVGIRPGEKMHEILVSEEEAHRCIDNGAYYVISPMLPELIHGRRSRRTAIEGEYSSSDHVLSVNETATLLRDHKLLPAQVNATAADREFPQ